MIVKRERDGHGELILIEADTPENAQNEYFDLSDTMIGKQLDATLPYKTATGKYAILVKVRR